MTQLTYDLYFQSLLFHQGINTTCKLGIKHYQALKDRNKDDLTESRIDCYGDTFSTDSLITLITFDV